MDDSLMKDQLASGGANKQQFYSSSLHLDTENSYDAGQNAYMLSNLRDYQDGNGSEDNKSTESWSSKIVSFQLTFAAFLLFTASFTFIGILSAPMLTQFDEAQKNKQLE